MFSASWPHRLIIVVAGTLQWDPAQLYRINNVGGEYNLTGHYEDLLRRGVEKGESDEGCGKR